jgi:16S rRNA C1402 N4-methylase RsmH
MIIKEGVFQGVLENGELFLLQEALKSHIKVIKKDTEYWVETLNGFHTLKDEEIKKFIKDNDKDMEICEGMYKTLKEFGYRLCGRDEK